MQSHSVLVLRVTDANTPKPKGLPPRLHSCYLCGLGGFSFWSVKMSNLEMLELAAKAAGIVVIRSRLDDPMSKDLMVKASHRNPFQVAGPWNPLNDDGDALRLAVKLSIDMSFNFENAVFVYADEVMETLNRNGNDLCAATRRAIVRAAAEIGRQMQEGGAA